MGRIRIDLVIARNTAVSEVVTLDVVALLLLDVVRLGAVGGSSIATPVH